MNFSDLNLITPLLSAVEDSGYTEPTPIQVSTIPLVLSGRDVLGCAQTGTGKTAAFALPILQRLHQEPLNLQKDEKLPIRALILTPTRELALQIYESFETYGANIAITTAAVFGGVSQNPQVQKLKKGVDILVATPGRLNDLIGQGHISLKKLSIFVLDEADRMLDMGFIHDVRRVISHLPRKRQTLFFSATMPDEVEKLAMTILHEPETVKVDPPASTVESIRQLVYLVDKVNKKKLLPWVLNQPEVTSALVFTRTKHGADRVVRELSREGVKALAIHGDKSQGARQEALTRFKSGDIKVLIATDIAARGIDIAELSHVINYELPDESENYVHRIGRTGRAGLEGDAISFCCYDEFDALRAIEKLIGLDLPVVESPWPMEVFTSTKDPDAREHRADRPRSSSRGHSGRGRGSGSGDSRRRNADASAKGKNKPARGENASASTQKKPAKPSSSSGQA